MGEAPHAGDPSRDDGSASPHRATSPRATVHLTRDVTNKPLLNNGVAKGGPFDVEREVGADGAVVIEDAGVANTKWP